MTLVPVIHVFCANRIHLKRARVVLLRRIRLQKEIQRLSTHMIGLSTTSSIPVYDNTAYESPVVRLLSILCFSCTRH
jgi:hypothetical protein